MKKVLFGLVLAAVALPLSAQQKPSIWTQANLLKKEWKTL